MTRQPHLSSAAQPFQLPGNSDLESTGLEQRLGLYQVFSRLYEQNRPLLDEILDLENLNHPSPHQAMSRYVVGMVQAGQAYLLTNLLGGGSQALYQAENLWVIGRAHDATLCLEDPRLSRYHAVIQYQAQRQGFCLVDLGSTNGSFVNGEMARSGQRLQDGDRVRLGSTVVQFFVAPESRQLSAVSPEVHNKLGSALTSPLLSQAPISTLGEETLVFLQGEGAGPPLPPQREAQQAALLERLQDQGLV